MIQIGQQSEFERRNPKWIVYRAAVYVNGVGVHLGGEAGKIWPPRAQALGKGCTRITDSPRPEADIVTARNAPWSDYVKPNSLDWLFVQQDELDLKQVRQVLKSGGHLIWCGAQARSESLTHGSWILKDEYTADDLCMVVAKYVKSGNKGVRLPDNDPRPRALVVRYGAIGDQIVTSALVKRLALDGYHVTVNASDGSHVILNNNPHVHNLLRQPKDFVYNLDLGEYWDHWAKSYDKVVNLSGSIETKYLADEGRTSFYLPKAERIARSAGVNYYEATLKEGGYDVDPDSPPRGEIYFTDDEVRVAKRYADSFRRHGLEHLLLVALKGSSFHKFYPLLAPTMGTWLEADKSRAVILTGGPESQELTFEHERAFALVDEWPIRHVMALIPHVDCVLGPETGLLNAAGCFDVPKVVLLSHSSADALTRYWDNVVPLVPASPCHPCFQMHHRNESCPMGQLLADGSDEGLVAPRCTIEIEPQRVLDALATAMPSKETTP